MHLAPQKIDFSPLPSAMNCIRSREVLKRVEGSRRRRWLVSQGCNEEVAGAERVYGCPKPHGDSHWEAKAVGQHNRHGSSWGGKRSRGERGDGPAVRGRLLIPGQSARMAGWMADCWTEGCQWTSWQSVLKRRTHPAFWLHRVVF